MNTRIEPAEKGIQPRVCRPPVLFVLKRFRAPGWDAEQRSWLSATRANLRRGGRAALVVGDGEGGIDALASTAAAAEACGGLQLLASASISSVPRRAGRHKGKRRPEHVLLLEAV